MATAGGLSEELHHVDLEHAALQQQFDHSAHVHHETVVHHEAPPQHLEAPYPAQYASHYQAPYPQYGAVEQVGYANPEWTPAAPPAAHIQTIIKKVPVPVPIERPIAIDNPISVPVERLVPVENPVPIGMIFL